MRLGKVVRIAVAGTAMLGLSALGGLSASAREAQAIPGNFKSAIVIANPNAVDATVSVNFVNSSGNPVLNPAASYTIAAGSNRLVYVPGLANLPDGRYAVVVDSDQPVVANANLESSGPYTSTAYVGIPQGDASTQFFIPEASRNYGPAVTSSSFVIQNAGSADANVTITYRDRNGNTLTAATETTTVKSNASVTMNQSDNANLPGGFLGSAEITSTQPVAAILLSSETTPTTLASARGARSGAPTANMPFILHEYYGHNTVVLVQNVDTTATSVEVEYFDAGGNPVAGKDTATIQPKSSTIFLQFNAGATVAKVPAGFNGSAVVRSLDNKNIIAVGKITARRDARVYGVEGAAGEWLEAYNGVTAAASTNKVTCPTILKAYVDPAVAVSPDPAVARGFNTGATVQNLGTGPTNLTWRYSDGTTIVDPVPLNPGATRFQFSPNFVASARFTGSLTVESSGQKIAAVVNQTGKYDNTLDGDMLLTYNCTPS
jgi:hypothetical protein